ncbi:MAG TPA: 23S rRNA (adenine(2030)-N(6))-methyltransferase RlmJ [Steroidobacteraceae bacterium]|nr:23S rRNA (adenine(2030)-N(6))-methyltransferase RlmJ [Steroidobacteraceae bacterium]
MKYRHSFHAGNFADVHKHVALLALIASLQRKDKGFLYLETHAGRGAYDLSQSPGSRAARAGLARVLTQPDAPAEIAAYGEAVRQWREQVADRNAYPGSPVLAAGALREQDRAILIELQPPEAHALERCVAHHANVRVELGDGYERLRGHLPPAERRGLVLIDPPYEEPGRDFERSRAAIDDALRRFATAVIMLWYPIKDARDTQRWRERLVAALRQPTLVSELWVHPCDSRVALNGSGVFIIHPPYQLEERMRLWLPQLRALLDAAGTGGCAVIAAPP